MSENSPSGDDRQASSIVTEAPLASTTTATRSPAEKRRATLVVRLAAIFVMVALSLGLGATAASAAASVQGPAGFSCDKYTGKVSISPPRVWASSRTEQVAWVIAIERWDGQRWYAYSKFTTYSSFNIYGQSVTTWSGGNYVNSTLNLPVYHSGYYRVASAVGGNQGGATWSGYVAGGNYCYVR